jgi:poly-gamma-glutamate capsule biosynthesis protein CapA/YwtB (metallophosphatase superfamily)
MGRPLTLVLTGDVMLGRGVNSALAHFGAAYPWGTTVPILREADLAIVNLECVIASDGRPWSRWRKVFHFRADPGTAIPALQLAGVDCVTLANNHVLDYEEEAFLEMLTALEGCGLPYTGAGRNEAAARRPVLLEREGVRIGVVACTDNEPGWAATATTPGTHYLPITLEEQVQAQVRADIQGARAAGADIVLLSLHWGPNMVERPTPQFQAFAHAAIEAGADVVYGHSAHLFQGIELYRGRPILYDLGDFVDDYAVDPELRNDWGIAARLYVTTDRILRIELVPVLIAHYQVNLAVGAVAQAIASRVRSLSAELGTHVQHDGDQLWIDCAAS